jgi:restriction modification system DNA specificity domain protein
MAKLGEVCTIVSGSTPKTSVTSYWDGNIKWITPAELNEDTFYIMDSVRRITEEGKEKTGLSYLPTGTVILSSRAPIGKTAIAGCEMCCNQGFKNLICSDAIYNEYLYFFLKSKTDYLNSLGRGATFKEISKSIVENIEIPLPEVNQQKEIAEKFKKLEQLISLRKQQLAKLDELVKARFVEMFGDPVTNPKGYEKYKLENLARKISDGVHSKPDYTETGRPFLSVVNINKGVINFKNCKYVSEDAYQKMIKSTHPERGDVLYTKVGATYGIPAYVDTDIAFCLYVSVCLIKPKREVINPRFLSLSMEMPYVKYQADRRIKGIGVPDLHLNQISEFEILCPPLKEQDIFIYFVERLDGEKRVVQQSLDKLELMKKALMQEYFG